MKIDRIKKVMRNNVMAVETGTFIGDGVQIFLDCGFKKVVSVEVDPTLASRCKQRFESNPDAEIVFGDSVQFLKERTKDFPNDVFIFLDGHFSGGGTSYFEKPVPLLDELKVILDEYKHDELIVVIDDVGCWTGILAEGDPARGWWSEVSEESILKIVEDSEFEASHYYDDEKITFILDLKRKTK
tara:strand:- start:1681 stop:2235 length:555 start_codon:yes stop_codon:yes gene_type:complete